MERPECRYRGAEDCRTEATEGDFTEGNVLMYFLDLRREPKVIRSDHIQMGGVDPRGNRISFTNYYMELNGRPFFPISGEFHYSRYPYESWEDEIVKMKMSGVNIVSTYVFWNHHEEDEGVFDWSGNKNLRYFVDLCAKQQLYVILRVGPFCHGEVRNGGIPDWLYGRPFDVRSNDEGYLAYVRRLYREIGRRVAGQFFKDGGPIIGVQLENEFMSSSAPWEVTSIYVHERVSRGSGGKEHMRVLKEIALESGLTPAFFTCTAWGSPVLEGEILPLHGGYAFCPWAVDESRPTHAPTPEYLFKDLHCSNPGRNRSADEAGLDGDGNLGGNSGDRGLEGGIKGGGSDSTGQALSEADIKAGYRIEDYLYACCEMGGGMQVWYKYRFVVPPESVEAMALCKVAGGCNFIGYYMYHGGSNPVGKHSYLNERVVPKISYDFQAPLGEFGQVRDSYRYLKTLHLFLHEFSDVLIPTATVLPDNSESITPESNDTLRYAGRVKGDSGFVFLNNYQDHVEMRDLKDIRMSVRTESGDIVFPRRNGFTLKKDECAILPINLDIEGARLRYSTAQLLTRLPVEDEVYYFFFAREGFDPEYCFCSDSVLSIEATRGEIERDGDAVYAFVQPGMDSVVRVASRTGAKVAICTLTRAQALDLWKAPVWGRDRVIISDSAVLATDGYAKLQKTGSSEMSLRVFPGVAEGLRTPYGVCDSERDGVFQRYSLRVPDANIDLRVEYVRPNKAVVHISPESFAGVDDVLLRIDYRGDVASAMIDGKLINDNFNNGTTWEIGLKRFLPEVAEKPIYFYVTPLRKGRTVIADSTAGPHREFVGEEVAEIVSIEAVPVYSVVVGRNV